MSCSCRIKFTIFSGLKINTRFIINGFILNNQYHIIKPFYTFIQSKHAEY